MDFPCRSKVLSSEITWHRGLCCTFSSVVFNLDPEHCISPISPALPTPAPALDPPDKLKTRGWKPLLCADEMAHHSYFFTSLTLSYWALILSSFCSLCTLQSLEDSGWLRWSFHHGRNWRRGVPGDQGFSQCPCSEFTEFTTSLFTRWLASCLKRSDFSCALVFQGVRHRLKGSANAVRIRAPQIGGEELSFYKERMFPLSQFLPC